MSTVITDASFCLKTKAAGWAAWIVLGRDNRLQKSGQLPDCPSAMEAEMMAALNGIAIAFAHGAGRVLLQTDCIAVVGCISGKKNKWLKARKRWNPLVERAFPDGLPKNVEARHVKGHTRKADARSWVNRWCDEHARAEMRALRRTLEAA